MWQDASRPDFSLKREFELSKKIYVGNLSFHATEEQVRDMFSEFGAIESLAMINDRDTGRFRGFAFVEMEDSAANAAIKALNGKEIEGRELTVNEAALTPLKVTRVVIRAVSTDPSIEESIRTAVSNQKKLEAMEVQTRIAEKEAQIKVTEARGIASPQHSRGWCAAATT